ncbi:MAG: radical SAM protein, partial [Conexivisphaerales archaeon]
MLLSFSRLWIWDELKDALPWYYAVSTNRMPAKYLITSRVPCDIDLSEDDDALWKEHAKATETFLRIWKEIRSGKKRLADFEKETPSFMDLSVELVRRMLRHCNFCRWNCRVDRSEGKKLGTCQLEAVSRVGSYFHHRGEELVFRGTRGSGTIFFTSCNMRCAFCQNADISRDKDRGIAVTPEQLATMVWQLRIEGCHNINWVGGEPTIHLHTIVEAVSLLDSLKPLARDIMHVERVKSDFEVFRYDQLEAQYDGQFNVPMLWNSNFFMSPETMRILRPLIDIWLPDFKFGNNKCAVFLARTPWYFETVSSNHKLIYEWGEDLVIRHLVMPNHVECCTKPVLDWIAENIPRSLVNIMGQYHPDYACDPLLPTYDPKYKDLSRYPSKEEIKESS